MSTWKPISTAPKDRRIDLWSTRHGLCGNCKWDSEDEMWIEQGRLLISAATHWKEPDKGPGQEEGEVRWMAEINGQLTGWAYKNKEYVTTPFGDDDGKYIRVVRVRIVREEE